MGFSLKTKSKIAPSPDMSAGFDDPKSPFFIPEEVRPFWADARPRVAVGGMQSEIELEAKSAAWEQTVSALGAEPTDNSTSRDQSMRLRENHYARLRAHAETVKSQMLDEHYTELSARVGHRLRLVAATSLAEAQAVKAARQMEDVKTYTCPVCGEYERGHGAPKTRPLAPGYDLPAFTLNDSNSITSCVKCYTVAAALYLEAVASQTLAPVGQTRRDVVKATLEQARVVL